MINDQGGINGRKNNFISRDDGYSPPKTVGQVRKLVEEDGVLLMFGTLGTPPNTAIQGYLNDNKVPQLFITSGADKWNDPKHFPWTMAWSPSYRIEARIFARYILKNLPTAKVAVLYQNDDFGKDYLIGLHEGLGNKAGKMIVAIQSYETTDPIVDSQVVALQGSGANVMVTAASPNLRHRLEAGALSRLRIELGRGGAAARRARKERRHHLGGLQQRSHRSAVALAWMKKYYPSGNITDFFTVDAYGRAQTMVAVLKASGDNLTRENVMKQAASIHDLKLPMLLPGITLSTSADDFAPIKQMQLEKVRWHLLEAVRRGDLGVRKLENVSVCWKTEWLKPPARSDDRGSISSLISPVMRHCVGATSKKLTRPRQDHPRPNKLRKG
jgi:branched-chain amino acid transport system substrate-binding protein